MSSHVSKSSDRYSFLHKHMCCLLQCFKTFLLLNKTKVYHLQVMFMQSIALAALAIRIKVSLGSVILNYSNRDYRTNAGIKEDFKSKLIMTQKKCPKIYLLKGYIVTNYYIIISMQESSDSVLKIVHSIIPGQIHRTKS